MALTKEKFHLRTQHSVLLGYWTAELGGLNQVVHIWYYGKVIFPFSFCTVGNVVCGRYQVIRTGKVGQVKACLGHKVCVSR